MRWSPASARTATGTPARSPARTSLRRPSAISRRSATWWSASAPARSPIGPTTCRTSWRSSMAGVESHDRARRQRQRPHSATAAEAGIAELEFLSGIPGTIGGGFRTNAGAYGREFKDALISADALDRSGELHTVTPAEMGLSYRHSDVDPDWIFVRARFQGAAANPAEIGKRMTEIRAAREASQPIRARTGGSTFANPPGHQ